MASTAQQALDAAVMPGVPIDAYALFRAAIRRSTICSLFGQRLAGHADQIGADLQPLLDLTDQIQTIDLHERLRTPLWRKAMQARSRVDEFIYAQIVQAREDPGAAGLLGELVQGGALSELELRDQVVSLIAAGYETTSAAMGWCVYHVGGDQDLQDQLRAELDSVTGGTPPRADDLRKLELLAAVVQETLRLYPPPTLSARYAAEGFTYGGYRDRAWAVDPVLPVRHSSRP